MRYKRLRKEENSYNANVVENSTLVVKAMFLCASGGRVVAGSNPVTPTVEKAW